VIVGAGSNSTHEGVEATKHATDIGADATLHVTGYYNMPTHAGFVDYFQAVADAAPETGVLMYNIPSRGHPRIYPAVMAALAREKKNIIGTKDATGGRSGPGHFDGFWRQVRSEARRRDLTDDEFLILSGDDPAIYHMMSDPNIAANGAISVWCNIFPRVYSEMTGLLLDGKKDEADEINISLRDLKEIVGVEASYTLRIGGEEMRMCDVFKNPQPVQWAANILGMSNGFYLRSPMMRAEEVGEMVGTTLRRLYTEHPEYFDPIERHFRPIPSIADRLNEY